MTRLVAPRECSSHCRRNTGYRHVRAARMSNRSGRCRRSARAPPGCDDARGASAARTERRPGDIAWPLAVAPAQTWPLPRASDQRQRRQRLPRSLRDPPHECSRRCSSKSPTTNPRIPRSLRRGTGSSSGRFDGIDGGATVGDDLRRSARANQNVLKGAQRLRVPPRRVELILVAALVQQLKKRPAITETTFYVVVVFVPHLFDLAQASRGRQFAEYRLFRALHVHLEKVDLAGVHIG